MKNKKRLLSLILALCLCMALAAPAWAADEFGKIMPSEIIYALDEVSTLSDSEIIANNDIVSQITKPSSLDIDNMINIDIRKVHQTYPLLDEQIALLFKRTQLYGWWN